MNALTPIQGIPTPADRYGMREKMSAKSNNGLDLRVAHHPVYPDRSNRASAYQRGVNRRRAEKIAKDRLRFGFLSADLG